LPPFSTNLGLYAQKRLSYCEDEKWIEISQRYDSS